MLSFKQKLFAIVFVILFISSNFCYAAKKKKQEISSELIEQKVLKEAGLRKIWQSNLPLRTEKWILGLFPRYEGVQKIVAANDKLFVFTDWGYTFCINADDGKIFFGQPVIRIGFNISEPIGYDNRVLFIAGNSLLEMDSDFGEQTRIKPLGFVATADPARNNNYVYITGSDKRLHAFVEDNWVQSFTAGQEDLAIKSVVANNEQVFFALEGGKIICIRANKAEMLWQFDTGRTVSAKLVLDGDELFVSSQDTNIYKFDTRRGKLAWRFQAGAVLVNPSRVTKKYVYQFVGHKGLVAIDKQTGKQIWMLAEGRDLLAENGAKSYIITNDGKLVVMNNEKATKVSEIDFSNVSSYVTNTDDSLIFVTDQKGRVACYKSAQ